MKIRQPELKPRTRPAVLAVVTALMLVVLLLKPAHDGALLPDGDVFTLQDATRGGESFVNTHPILRPFWRHALRRPQLISFLRTIQVPIPWTSTRGLAGLLGPNDVTFWFSKDGPPPPSSRSRAGLGRIELNGMRLIILDKATGESFDAAGTSGSGVSETRSIQSVTVRNLAKRGRVINLRLYEGDAPDESPAASWSVKF